MSDPLRFGLIGAGWGAAAHIPALRSVDGIELAAVCTSRPETAARAAQTYGVAAYSDVRELAAQPDIDVISVVVRVPFHHDLVVPALEAGKHVFCEWPLGATLAEAQDMTAVARRMEVVTAVGLQGRQDPALGYIKQLHDEGWFGDVMSVRMTMFGSGAGRSDSRNAWMGDAANGANLMTIVVGHSLDSLSRCFGPLTAVSASVSTQFPQWHLADTGETIDVDAPDSVALTGTLAGGGRLSFHMASVPYNGSGWRMAVHGTEGTLIATTEGLPQITPVAVTGARGDEPLAPMPLPERFDTGQAAPEGPAGNIARAYARIDDAVRSGTRFQPDFDHAVRLHEMLDALQRSSDEGRTVDLGELA